MSPSLSKQLSDIGLDIRNKILSYIWEAKIYENDFFRIWEVIGNRIIKLK